MMPKRRGGGEEVRGEALNLAERKKFSFSQQLRHPLLLLASASVGHVVQWNPVNRGLD